MNALQEMILMQMEAKRYAGAVVREMIRQGCDGRVMRLRKIPQSVFCWVLGSRAYVLPLPPATNAYFLTTQYRRDYLGLQNAASQTAAPKTET